MRDGHSQFIRRKLFPRFCSFFFVRACVSIVLTIGRALLPVLSLFIQELRHSDKHL